MRAGCLTVVLATVLLGVATALACDDHVGKCDLEAWRASASSMGVSIDGSATCDKGSATIRLYDGDKFLGVANGFIEGHALQAVAMDVPTYANLKIKYSIRPR